MGLWKARGYGWLLEIGADGYALFDYTDISCVEFERGSREQFERGFDRVELHGDSLSLHVGGDITRYTFDRTERFPAPPIKLGDARRVDAEFNFDVFWRTFQQDYAFFDRHGIDWLQIYERHRPRVTRDTTPDALRAIFEEMLAGLRDNHVNLQTPGRLFVSDRIADIKRWMVDTFALDTPSLGDPKTIANYQAYIGAEILRGRGKTAGNNLVSWGRVTPRVGYVAILRLFGFADTPQARVATGLPVRRDDFAQFLRDDLRAIETIFDDVLGELSDTDALIVDIRVNGGGFDKAGIAIANRFADRKRLAFTKRAREGAGLGPIQALYVEPARTVYTKPVYLLTAQRTASAGEIFALCMATLPHVVRVGQPTLGIFSDDLAKHLPNGWKTSLSNEVYATPAGIVYEGDGVPPDVTVPVFDEHDLRGSLKRAVEEAIRLANGRDDDDARA